MPSIATHREQNKILSEKNNELLAHLSALIDSSAFNIEKLTNDCIANFERFNWEKHPEADKEKFDKLYEKLSRKKGNAPDLVNFFSLVKLNSKCHVAAWLYSSESLVTEL